LSEKLTPRPDRAERLRRVEGVLLAELGALHPVDVGGDAAVLVERLLVPRRDAHVAPPVAEPLLEGGELPLQEAVEDAVARLAVDAEVPRVARALARAAAPVDPGLRVDVVVQVPVVARVLDGAPVGGAVAQQLGHAEARREEPAAPAAARIGEDEREPHHRHVADVEHRRPDDQDALRDHLDVARLEVVVRRRLVARRDGAVARVEDALAVHHGVADDRPRAPPAPATSRRPARPPC
jgi:hypothetical protein